LPSFLHW